MFARQLERRLSSVVERPAVPVGWVVALRAVGPKPPFVNVLVFMTAHTRC